MADEPLDVPLETLVAPPARPPFASFMHRSLAFVLDLLLLYLIGRFIFGQYLRPLALALNPALPWLGLPLALAYFWLTVGPVGRGQTLGMLLMRIQVVDRAGQMLGWWPALRRALLQGAVLPVVMVNPGAYVMIFPPSQRYAVMAAITLVRTFALLLLVAQVCGVLMHPNKRAWHDLWAGSFVTWRPLPESFTALLAQTPDVITARKLVLIPRMTLIFWLIACPIVALRPLKMIKDPVSIDLARRQAALAQAHPLPQYTMVGFNQADPSLETKFFLPYINQLRGQTRARGSEPPTTDTLRLLLPYNGQTVAAQYFRRRGAVGAADVDDPALRTALDRLRAASWRESDDAAPAGDDRTATATARPRLFVAQLIEPVSFLFYNDARLCGIAYGPADPAAGPLTFEPMSERAELWRPKGTLPPDPAEVPTTATMPAQRTDDGSTTATPISRQP